jgi:hypothetical protein
MGVTRCGPVRIPHRAVIYPRGHPVPVYTSRAVVPLVRLLSERGTQQEAVRATPGKQPRCFRSDETNAQKRHRTRGPGEACTPQTRPPIPGQLPGPTRHSRCRFHQGTDRAVRGRLFLAPVPGPRSYPEGEPAMVERQTPDDSELEAAGWLPVHVWEHEDPDQVAERVEELWLTRTRQ